MELQMIKHCFQEFFFFICEVLITYVMSLLHTQLFVCNMPLSFSLPIMVISYRMCDWIVSVTCDEMIVVNELVS